MQTSVSLVSGCARFAFQNVGSEYGARLDADAREEQHVGSKVLSPLTALTGAHFAKFGLSLRAVG